MVHSIFRVSGLKNGRFTGIFPGFEERSEANMVQNQPPEPSKEPESTFEARLAKARKSSKARGGKKLDESSAYGVATRLVAELVSGLVIGGGIGWLLDRWLGTKPWMMVVFFLLGAGAGLSNVVRAAKQMNEQATRRAAEKEDED